MLRKFAVCEILEVIAPGAPLSKTGHRATFDHIPRREGFLYVSSRAISSRCNDNFDYFGPEEIKKSYLTFIGKPVFVNHNNEDYRRARGVIVDAVLHEDVNPDGSPDTWVQLLHELDAVKYPKLAKAIIAGKIDRTSMGCDVQFSKCSACGNVATSPMEYCAHIPGKKGQKLFRFNKEGKKVGQLIFEICSGLSFFENSWLVEQPADPTAYRLGDVELGPGLEHMAMTKTASRTAELHPIHHTPIREDQARGDSRPVSAEEFHAIAEKGRHEYGELARNSSPHTGLDQHWDALKDHSYNETRHEWGGATIDSHTGVPIKSDADKYAITVNPPGVNTISTHTGASREEFNATMDHAKNIYSHVLQREGHHLGVFRDDDEKVEGGHSRIDFNPVAVVPKHQVETIGAYTHAIGGAYHFKSGNGFWPPHVKGLRAEGSVRPSDPRTAMKRTASVSSVWNLLRQAEAALDRDERYLLNQVSDRADKKVVNLEDPSSLKNHLIDAHGLKREDFRRGLWTKEQEGPLDGSAWDKDPMSHEDMKTVHAWQHTPAGGGNDFGQSWSDKGLHAHARLSVTAGLDEANQYLKDNPIDHHNILNRVREAASNPSLTHAGMKWYDDAHGVAKTLAAHHNVPLHHVAGALGVYSASSAPAPNFHYASLALHAGHGVYSQKDKETGEQKGFLGDNYDAHGAPMASQTDAKKVDRILGGEHFEKVIGSSKTKTYARLINNPDNDHDVVVDRHAVAAAVGHQGSSGHPYGIVAPAIEAANKNGGGKIYDQVADSYRKATDHINNSDEFKGFRDHLHKAGLLKDGEQVKPHHTQALAWIVQKNISDQHNRANSGAQKSIDAFQRHYTTRYGEHAYQPSSYKHFFGADPTPQQKESFRRARAYGETKAPEDVDTLRTEACTICGNTSAFNGRQCQVCGFVQPIRGFGDPDTDAAAAADLRKNTMEGNETDPNDLNTYGPGDNADSIDEDMTPATPMLECNNCGTGIQPSPPATTTDDPDAEPPFPAEGDVCPVCKEGELGSTGESEDEEDEDDEKEQDENPQDSSEDEDDPTDDDIDHNGKKASLISTIWI